MNWLVFEGVVAAVCPAAVDNITAAKRHTGRAQFKHWQKLLEVFMIHFSFCFGFAACQSLDCSGTLISGRSAAGTAG
jgi:hypothetical protein